MAFGAARAERGSLTGARAAEEVTRPGASPAVLALHGFGGTPFEVELAADAAAQVGLAALAPLLPGHGTHGRDLARLGFRDWSRGAEEGLERLPGKAIVVGLSLGSLLALDLAQRRPEKVSALVLMANAVWLTAPFPRWALMAAARLRLPDFAWPKQGPDIGDQTGRATHVSYDAHPVHAAIEVQRAGARLAARLAEVRCPTLVLHGAKDRTCPVANAWRVAERLGSDDCRVVIFPRSRHILTRDVEREAVARELRDFFQRVASSPDQRA
ncbi:MAG TPA: alpha/beta fold hydrolase [Polyangiaceae bacterium]|nr:alpha/beta fold hydrolase [Polyangiaceae bacterium]